MRASTHSLIQTAALLGVNRSTISSWISRGAPVVEKADRSLKKEWKLSLPDIVNWRIETSVADATAALRTDGQISKDEADRRKAVAQAGLAEVELDERRRSVMLVADANEMMADFCQSLKSGVDNGISKTAGRAATLTDPHEIMEFFGAEWNRSMRNAQSLLNEKWADWHGNKAGADAAAADDTATDNNEDFEP
jgi:terminase small subunit / prophage DNA-packing protein